MSDLTPPPIKLRWIVGVLAGFMIFVVIAAYSSRMARDAGDYDQQRRTERLALLAKQRAADEQTLTTADWVDQGKGVVRIPIDEAMPQAVAALKAKPVQMGAAIPGAAPVAAGAPNAVPAAKSAPSKAAAPKAPTN
jgi:phage-related minor tail protein